MTKNKKIMLIVITTVLFITAIGFVIFFNNLCTFHFEYQNVSGFSVFSSEEYDTTQELQNKGFDISYPEFTASGIRRMTGYRLNEELAVYAVINDNTLNYLTELAKQYNNRVKLDYSVDKQNGTLTIEFFGTAYPSSIDGESIAIIKTFIYDIGDVSVDNLPKLIS